MLKLARSLVLGALVFAMPAQAISIPSVGDLIAHVKGLMGKKEQGAPKPTVRIVCLAVEGRICDSTALVKKLYTLRKDVSVHAVLIKIDSGGGAGGSSDILYDELLRLEQVKPVIVFVENACCSAAYQMACAASYIVAPRSAAVGSIGVVSTIVKNKTVKFKDGIFSGEAAIEVISSGKYKVVTHPDAPALTDDQRAYLQQRSDESYALFCDDVARARGLNRDEHSLWADGQVFTGCKALELGLIDKVGCPSDAVEMALQLVKERLGVEGEPQLIEIADYEKK